MEGREEEEGGVFLCYWTFYRKSWVSLYPPSKKKRKKSNWHFLETATLLPVLFIEALSSLYRILFWWVLFWWLGVPLRCFCVGRLDLDLGLGLATGWYDTCYNNMVYFEKQTKKSPGSPICNRNPLKANHQVN